MKVGEKSGFCCELRNVYAPVFAVLILGLPEIHCQLKNICLEKNKKCLPNSMKVEENLTALNVTVRDRLPLTNFAFVTIFQETTKRQIKNMPDSCKFQSRTICMHFGFYFFFKINFHSLPMHVKVPLRLSFLATDFLIHQT